MSERRILVVDDDDDIRDALVDCLRDEGYEAVAAATGTAAMEELRRGLRPALILLDWNMTPMTGEEFLSALRADGAVAGLRVAVLTADSQVSAEAAAGTVAFVQKPVVLDDLLTLVADLCGGG